MKNLSEMLDLLLTKHKVHDFSDEEINVFVERVIVNLKDSLGMDDHAVGDKKSATMRGIDSKVQSKKFAPVISLRRPVKQMEVVEFKRPVQVG